MTRIVALTNQKGGVGKTTVTYHVARAAGLAGLRTLVIDADPQGNSTSILTENVRLDDLSLADVLAPNSTVALSEVIVPGPDESVRVVPAGGDNLAAVEQLLVGVPYGRESRLRTALAEVAHNYELVLIDCNPSINLLTTNALVAATHALAVIKLDEFSLNGFGRLNNTLREVRTHYNSLLRLLGVQVNAYESRTTQAKFWLADLTEQANAAGIPVLDPLIPLRKPIAEAMEGRIRLSELSTAGRELAPLYDKLLATITTEP